jgi:predicted HTH domain antitoxin
MKSVQLRLPDKELKEMDSLSEEMKLSRSEVARNALHEGLKKLRMEVAVRKYLDEELSLGGAADYAGVTIHEMASFLSKVGVPFFRYAPSELERDAEKAKEWMGE